MGDGGIPVLVYKKYCIRPFRLLLLSYMIKIALQETLVVSIYEAIQVYL
jgi:hypothetical protein